ncbi:MAG: 5-deoxy-glucuronate isomerase [Pseudonocardiales bacterium]|nr:5-deoxy-glucuronate isomerase [Pseudonocardiales bacterium]MDT4948457.1 5-deoxy-glucuronate isomerase [Pseudonocardiales bacterium]
MIRNLVEAGKQTDLIDLGVAELGAGERLDLEREGETAVVVLSGVVDVRFGDTDLGTAGGRASVFEAPGDTVYAPPGRLELTAQTYARLAITSAPLADLPPAQARIVRPEDQRIAEVGAGNWLRTVRTILGPEHRAGRLLIGETINPPGNWSSYPPHKHDTHEPPREVKLEEVYYFDIEPAGGFGIQLQYQGEDEDEKCYTVRSGDTATIKSGYHPVVAAPGYQLYYLWVMAGEGREMIPYLDPRYRWIQFPS